MPKVDETHRQPLASIPVGPRSAPSFSEHCYSWAGGCGSVICGAAASRCYARGTIPCDVLFIGEAPGESEDALGLPFVGPAGKLQDRIVAEALLPWQVEGTEGPDYNSVTWAYSNLVLCIPREIKTDDYGRPLRGEDGTVVADGKAGEPEPEQIRDCSRRLAELIAICAPRLIVCVGALSRTWLTKEWPSEESKVLRTKKYNPLGAAGYTGPLVAVEHPAFILRANQAMRGLMIQKSMITIREAVGEMMEGRG